jgi:heme-degrading monooxygenase HmoA
MTILRIWRGATARERGDVYVDYLNETGLRDYRETRGNLGAMLLRRDDGDLARFTTLSLWGSLDDIRAFAGDDAERARFYPADDDFLVEREERVEHHEVVAGELGGAGSAG